MFVVGITGGIGAGKTTVADYFAARGITLVDADQAARQVVEPGQPVLAQIAAHFGPGTLFPDGQLDRRALRERIFNHAPDRHWLEQQLHPLINALLKEEIANARSAYVALVSPLLFEAGQRTLVDRVLVVDVPESVQIERAMRRDKLSGEHIQAIMRSQMDRQTRLRLADDSVNNNATPELLHAQLDRLHRDYIGYAAQ